jgi:hypothetical protein
MHIGKIKPFRLNNVTDTSSVKLKVTLEHLNQLYKNYENVFIDKNFEVNEKASLKEVYLLMLCFIKKNTKCEVFDDITYDYDYQSGIENLTEITFANSKYYSFSKIDLHQIYLLRKNTQVFHVLVYLIKRASKYIDLLHNQQNEYEFCDILGDWGHDCENDAEYRKEYEDEYFAGKEYSKIIKPFMGYISEFKTKYKKEKVFEILKDEPKWLHFAKQFYIFSRKPSSPNDYCHYFSVNDDDDDGVTPVQCCSYYGFSWNPQVSSYDKVFTRWTDTYMQEGGELYPMLVSNYKETQKQKDSKLTKLKTLYKFLNYDS